MSCATHQSGGMLTPSSKRAAAFGTAQPMHQAGALLEFPRSTNSRIQTRLVRNCRPRAHNNPRPCAALPSHLQLPAETLKFCIHTCSNQGSNPAADHVASSWDRCQAPTIGHRETKSDWRENSVVHHPIDWLGFYVSHSCASPAASYHVAPSCSGRLAWLTFGQPYASKSESSVMTAAT